MLNLICWSAIDGRFKCAIKHALGDPYQLASHRKIVDSPAVVDRVDDRRRFRSQAREILRNRYSGDVESGGKEGLKRDRIGNVVLGDQLGSTPINFTVQRLEEMVRL